MAGGGAVRLAAWAGLLGAALAGISPALAQVPATALPPADIELVDASSLAHLDSARRFLEQQQWADAVEAIRRVQEAGGSRLIRRDQPREPAGFELYVPARAACQQMLAAAAATAPAALAHYRQLVDPLAETWYRDGAAVNDERLLRRVVEQALASSAGDQALLKLGDLALARGQPAEARAWWERLGTAVRVPAAAAELLGAAEGSPLWLALRKFDMVARGQELAPLLAGRALQWGDYPDSELDPASIRARLVLASLFEGAAERAAVELALLRLLHPQAAGRLGGKEGLYGELLAEIAGQAATWQPQTPPPDWPMLGGSAERFRASRASGVSLGRLRWTYRLPRLAAPREVLSEGRVWPADDRGALRSYHPIVVRDRVLLALDAEGNSYVVALDLQTGQPLWQVDASRGLTSSPAIPLAEPAATAWETNDILRPLAAHLGVARYTLTSDGQRVFARLGSAITVPTRRRVLQWLPKDQGFVLGLDLATEGQPLEGFPLRPPGSEWTLEGTPLVRDGVVYVAQRRVEVGRALLSLAAYELLTTPPGDADAGQRPGGGRLRWQTRLGSSVTLGGGQLDELTHLLATLDGGRIYLNTSAGLVAALEADDGALAWVVKYPRTAASPSGSGWPRHWFRDLTPCLAWRGLLFVAPADCERIFALQAASGELAWSLPPGTAADAMHLLGVHDDVLVAAGDHLYWIDAYTGRLLTQFPPGALGGDELAAPQPRGLGRGLVAGGRIYWPTREAIYVFEGRPAVGEFGYEPRLVGVLPLAPYRLTGGNLVLADGLLLVAAGEQLAAIEIE